MNARPFDTLLIANRGEIACRVIATCRRLGIRSVAVYSDADANARHVRLADVALPIGPAPARESYLDSGKIIDAAKRSGAQAIHPGYGFLSENADFARACADAGIVFIGPPVAAIEAMGSKSAAKALMEQAGVPLTPGYHGDNQEADFLHAQADAIGYPVLIKASAGGGGKGMRRVDRSADFPAALVSCRREAASSFGNEHVLVEKYVLRPRHIEIQVFGDTHGKLVHLHERDCSVQRRHQKVLEEAPAPGMTPERRAAMGAAAVEAARAVGYVGAGTVEFIAAPDGAFYFMEMNTRLQVEHPVTEMITGLDLVEWQLRVAAGEPLPLAQQDIPLRGHAIEARLYAEDAERGFLPSTGTLALFDPPQGEGVRVDSGIETGDTVSPFYDPMIAKLIVHGADRDTALARMRQALATTRVAGVASNAGFLQRLIAADSAFARADLDTGLIEREHDALFPPSTPASPRQIALATLAALLDETAARAAADPHSPWAATRGWRLSGPATRQLRWHEGDTVRIAQAQHEGQGWRIEVDGEYFSASGTRDGHLLHARLNGAASSAAALAHEGVLHLFDGGEARVLGFDDPIAQAESHGAHGGDLSAPMPGRIVALLAEPGKVQAGTPLLVM
ncbi:MAG: acetyl/propionyl/methylcrotonyl-CoA carboxylase subunit alpha, partial [Gammaproteobacteria bacterium]|nr:acetyl/propionyl/methylcrotonyl-CoA carboxylase subunit alpha [Gammaproteobacteria bacterium]